jgi:hypothetical protein
MTTVAASMVIQKRSEPERSHSRKCDMSTANGGGRHENLPVFAQVSLGRPTRGLVWADDARSYITRKLGKTRREARRARKRHLANRVIGRMWNDETNRQEHSSERAARRGGV